MKFILVRHGKSNWDTNQTDHDRPLAPRGIKAAEKIGRWLVSKEHLPQTVLCSTATRTRQTWEGISKLVPAPTEEVFVSALYGASPGMMLKHLQNAKSGSVMMIGHNPGSAELASIVLRTPPRSLQFFRFPTCATMVCEFPNNECKDINPGEAHLLDFVVPREL